jgi:hypothetical protein
MISTITERFLLYKIILKILYTNKIKNSVYKFCFSSDILNHIFVIDVLTVYI